MADDIRLVRVDEIPFITETGNLSRRRRLIFMVGPIGPLSVDLTDAEFAQGMGAAKMEEVAREIRKLRGTAT